MRTTRLSWALLALSMLAVLVVAGTLDTGVSRPAMRSEQRPGPEPMGSPPPMGSPRRLRPPFQAPFEMADPARMILYTSPFPAHSR
jgi:hypothetical protein